MQSGARGTMDAGVTVPMAPVKSGPGSADSRLFWHRQMKRKEPSQWRLDRGEIETIGCIKMHKQSESRMENRRN